jgi:hypothetical protein
MNIEPTGQPGWGPADKPLVKNPVNVALDVPVYYCEDDGAFTQNETIFCGRAFADTVLIECNKILQANNFALAHLGFYYPRKARRKDGSIIKPERWSNHSFGEAVDFKGVITEGGEGEFLGIEAMKEQCPDKLQALVQACQTAIKAINRNAEIVDEGEWYHIGLWPA